MLEKIIKPNYITLNIQASDWQDAIRKSAIPLLQDHAITSRYVDEIINSVKNYGPYFVVAPRVALAHAPAKFGVNTLAMGLTTLKPAVDFHNKENDPVSFIFTLCAPDSDSHLTALQELVALLSQDDFYKCLDTAHNESDIFNYINAFCQQTIN